jgi:putative colanic acid polymerase
MPKNSRNFLNYCIPIFFVFLHFEVAEFFGFNLTVGAIVGFAMAAFIARWQLSKRAVLIFLATNLVLLITPLASPTFFNLNDYITTGLLVQSSLILLLISVNGSRLPNLIIGIAPGLKIAFWIVALFSIIQISLSTFFNFYSYNPWGDNQYLYKYIPLPGATGLIRSAGFYLEPSFNAFVICALTLLVMLTKGRPLIYMPISLLAVAATQSATGLILWFSLAAVAVVFSRSFRSIRYIFVISLPLVAAYGYLSQRINSISLTGSSGNYRLLSPTSVVGDILSSQFFGHPLGSLYDVVSRYQLFQFGAEQSVTLDNGLYVIIFYFGWIGLLVLIGLFVWALSAIRREKIGLGVPSIVVRLWLVSCLLFSGAIFAPEFACITFLVVVVWRESLKEREPSL